MTPLEIEIKKATGMLAMFSGRKGCLSLSLDIDGSGQKKAKIYLYTLVATQLELDKRYERCKCEVGLAITGRPLVIMPF